MKRIFLFLKSFHFIFLLTFIVLAAVIYFFGSKIPFLRDYQIEAFWALAIIYVTYYLFLFIIWSFRKWRIRNARDSGVPDENEVLLYLGQVEHFIRSASNDLGIRNAIKYLPLYWVTGSQQTGKTAFIKGSNDDPEKVCTLELALGECSTSWHLSKQGVFFECSLDQIDSVNQQLLIQLFRWFSKKTSRLGQFSSIILLLKTDTLALGDQELLYADCKKLTALMKACAAGTGYIYPTVLVLSHLDHLHGCQAYFDHTDQQDGTFLGAIHSGSGWRKASPSVLINQMKQHIQALYDRVMNSPAPSHQSFQQKLAWSGFPFQMQQLNQHLGTFLNTAAQELQQLNHPGFSAVFLTAAQKGSQEEVFHAVHKAGFLERKTSVEWRKENRPNLLLSGIHQLLANGLGTTPVAAVTTTKQHFRKSLLASLVLVTVMVITLGIAHSDWQKHNQFVEGFRENIEKIVVSYNETHTNAFANIILLKNAIQQFGVIQKQQSYLKAIGLDWPLMQVVTRERISSFLAGAMKDEFDPVLVDSLTQALEDKGRNWINLSEQQKSLQRDEYYALLEAYLIMTRFPERMQPSRLASTVAPVWYGQANQRHASQVNKTVLNATEKVLFYFYAHVFNYAQAERWAAISYDRQLVTKTRQNLAVEATAEAIYQLLVSKNQQYFEPVKLSDVIPASYPYILRNDYQFSSMYSRDAWEQRVADEIKRTVQKISMDDWVLGDQVTQSTVDNTSAPLETRVRELYFEDYRTHWEAYIRAFYMPEYSTLDEVHHNLKLLGGDRSPLVPLADYLNYQLGAYKTTNHLDKLPTQFKRKSQSRFSVLEAFVGFYQVDESEDFQQYLADVNQLAAEIESMLSVTEISNEALKYASSMLSNQDRGQQLHALNLSINRIKLSHEPRAGELLQQILLLPVKSTWQTILNSARDTLQAEWERNVFEHYLMHLSGRFPFKTSSEDVALSGFQQFFGNEQGVLWRFYKDKASPFVTLHTSSIENNAWLGMGLKFNDAYLNALKDGRLITRAILDSTDDSVGFRYALMPEPLPDISESRFTLDEFLLVYRNEPQQWRDHSWSAGRHNSLARVQLRQLRQPLSVSIQAEGVWALLRLLHKAQIKKISNIEYELVWSIPDASKQIVNARYRLRSDQASLLLNKELFTNYNLPRKIFSSNKGSN